VERRLVLAAALMFAVVFVYTYFLTPQQTPPPPKPQETASTPAAPSGQGVAPTTPGAAPGTPAASSPLPAKVAGQAPVERTAVVDGPLYHGLVSSTGAALVEWRLRYRGEKDMTLPGVFYSRGLEVVRSGRPAERVALVPAVNELKLGPERPAGELVLEGDDGYGLAVRTVLAFKADSYEVDQRIRVENRNNVDQQIELLYGWQGPAEWQPAHEKFTGARPIHVVRLGEGSFWPRREYLKDAAHFAGPGKWIGFESGPAPTGQNGVYLIAMLPRSKGVEIAEDKVDKDARIAWKAAPGVLKPGQSWEGRASLFLGPMEFETLKATGATLERAIYFGGFPFPESWAQRYGLITLPMEWIVVPILKLMHWVYGFARNYGVAIIILTVITKIIFFPLSVKSVRSMKAMQAIQPLANQIRSKYKNDPQRVQRETMELYRQHGVNPIGGCLPMIVQIPVFYALYVALSVSVELQSAPFLCFGRAPSWLPWLGGADLWICNLAAPDPTYVLPLLMGATMFIQQKMTPVVGDPRQAKMMLLMPIVFTAMFFSLWSGLVLYWTLSNVLQIGQQYYLDRTAKAKVQSGDEPRPEKTTGRAAKKA
jgi:YidC/Oxa1 family membrane protein insertase